MKRFLLVLTLSTGLSACTYAYIPLVPESATFEPLVDLRGSSGIRREGDSLRLHVNVRNIPAGDWLAVQWFSPDNRLAASDSVWLEPNEAATEHTFSLPADVTFTPGRWRVVVSYRGQILRQFSL